MEEQYKSSFVRALAERWQFWRPMAVEKVGKMDRARRLILRSALDSFDVFNRMNEFLEKLDGDDKVRLVIEAEIKALAAAIEEAPMFVPSDDDTMGGTVDEPALDSRVEEAKANIERMGLATYNDTPESEEYSEVKDTAPEEPDSQYVQKFDDETQRWQIINKETGEVTNRKKSPGPYKSLPYMFEVKDAGDGEAREQANTADQAEDQQ